MLDVVGRMNKLGVRCVGNGDKHVSLMLMQHILHDKEENNAKNKKIVSGRQPDANPMSSMRSGHAMSFMGHD